MKMVALLNLATVTLAGLVPKSELVARSCGTEPPVIAEPFYTEFKQQLVNNATLLFAWQFAATVQGFGAKSDPSSLSNIIQHEGSHIDDLIPHVNAFGANGGVFAKLLPGRLGCGANVDAENNVNQILKYARLVLQTELHEIFPRRSNGFTVLCDNWDLGRLQTFFHTKENAKALHDWVCAGSDTGKSTKSVTTTSIPATAASDFVSSISAMFAWELLGTLMNSEQVKTACTKDWDAFSANMKKTGLNPSEVQKVFCTSENQNSLPNSSVSADIIKDKTKALATHLLIAQLLALSGEHEYQAFVCSSGSYKLGNLYVLGLDGNAFYQGIQTQCKGLGF
ncbi:hypothetical protein FKW77_008050 [Venturia effusa]|uniref:Lysine-specific metallo-endopeptidase domain-containing protein n=1 Tax=Venturia effusa TaxID=50376 RepID=A0A517L7S4_9PEZI|nr:hypothetical protein FKW77_008050 [Venturia effusa]